MKKWISVLPIAAVLLIAYGIISTQWKTKEVALEEFPDNRRFEITYAGSFQDIPQDSQTFRAWIPLASSRDGQRIVSKTINLPVPYQITTDAEYGNEIIYFELSEGIPLSIDFSIDYEVEVSKDSFLNSNKESNPAKYLKPSTLMKVTDEVLGMVDTTAAKHDTVPAKVRAIYDHVLNHMAYDKKTPGYGEGDTLRACLIGKGNCTDFHSLFISMAQASQVPARFKMGMPVPPQSVPESAIGGYHCWAEFYQEGEGWQPVDASEAWKHPEKREAYYANFDTNKFLLSVGRDIPLSPAPATGPVNLFFYPHVEVNGEKYNGFKGTYSYKNVGN